MSFTYYVIKNEDYGKLNNDGSMIDYVYGPELSKIWWRNLWTAPYVYTFTSAISWRSPSCKSSHYWSYDGRGSLSICLHHSQHVSITWQPRGTRVQHRMSLPVPSQSTLHHTLSWCQFVMVKNKNKYILAKSLKIYK